MVGFVVISLTWPGLAQACFCSSMHRKFGHYIKSSVIKACFGIGLVPRDLR